MARTVDRLHPKAVKSITKPGRYADGNGLYLLVTERQKSWTFRYRWEGKLKEAGVGPASGDNAVGLAAARQKAQEARRLVEQGIRPGSRNMAKAAATEATEATEAPETPGRPRVPTFGEMADRYISDNEAGWRNAKHRDQWRMTLGRKRDKNSKLTGEGYCLTLADKRIDQITVEDVQAEIAPLWGTKQETASRIRGRIEKVLGAATVLGYWSGPNPAAWSGNLQHLLPKRKKLAKRGHHPAMPYEMLPDFMVTLRAAKGISARCLEFTLLTACRSGESRLARWREIDHEARYWTIPEGRMKGEREHVVPLSTGAMAVLAQMELLRDGDDGDALIFPSSKDTPLSDMALLTCMDRPGAGEYTPHGTARSSFRDWCGDETDFERETAELALAHVIGGTEGAYRRKTALRKRAAIMQLWSDYLDGKGVKVPAKAARPGRLLRRRRLSLRRPRTAMASGGVGERELTPT